ncbi:DUF4241 domain-containing protein [Neorhizobium alkalisoli]|uniref:Uncharacterized protein DUF4241 n=1 Tax=Neorhizobium alkalisoli TaxID=528178 RepID=A0A561QIT7_9HYPH|nr:DUF4241 domain-containing protein [Neorhizobium alkalisoli]TWF50269.1 uncharacterized protein DUF4241 [Neorhizobium alkalisoli]
MIALRKTYLAAPLAALALLVGGGPTHALDLAKISPNLVVFTDRSRSLESRRLVEIPIGQLPLADGRLVAMDPLVQPDRKPFTRPVPTGTYPVSLIRGASEYDRPALLVIRFSGAEVKSFELALIEGQDVGTLKKDEFFGIPVDAGVAAFANSGFAAAQAKRDAAEQEKLGSRYGSYYDTVLSAEMPGTAGNEHVFHRPLDDSDGAAAITQAGWGDGFYPVLFGLDESGKPALAFIDFYVIEDGDGRSDFEKEKDAVLAALTPQQQDDNKSAYQALKSGDETAFAHYISDKRIAPKDYVLESGGSFMLEAIRLDRPVALAAMLKAGADDRLSPYDEILNDTYSAFAQAMNDHAAKAKAEGKTDAKPRSSQLMAVIAELKQRPGGSDQPK